MDREPTVFIIDDDPGVLRSLCWLARQAGLPAQAYSTGREFLDAYQGDQSGCLVLDMRMPEMDGLEVQRRLSERNAELPIIFLTAHGDVPTCVQALKSGALEFLEKPVDHTLLLDCILRALQRSAQNKQRHDFSTGVSQLSPAEKQVLDLLVAGKSIKQIATLRRVSVQTTWKQRLSIWQKLGVASDLELVRLATQLQQERE